MNTFLPLLSATGITLSIALCALLLGLILAFVFTAWEFASWRPLALMGTLVVTLIRGLPEILVVVFIYFGSAQLLFTLSELGISGIEDFNVSPFLCGVIALAFLYAAYASQTFRGALKAVPATQRESGQALGMGKVSIFFRIIMPQMWRHALPGLGNQWLVLLKDTALVSLISVNDLMLQAKSIALRTQSPFTWYLIAAAIYLGITLCSQGVLMRLENRYGHARLAQTKPEDHDEQGNRA